MIKAKIIMVLRAISHSSCDSNDKCSNESINSGVNTRTSRKYPWKAPCIDPKAIPRRKLFLSPLNPVYLPLSVPQFLTISGSPVSPHSFFFHPSLTSLIPICSSPSLFPFFSPPFAPLCFCLPLLPCFTTCSSTPHSWFLIVTPSLLFSSIHLLSPCLIDWSYIYLHIFSIFRFSLSSFLSISS